MKETLITICIKEGQTPEAAKQVILDIDGMRYFASSTIAHDDKMPKITVDRHGTKRWNEDGKLHRLDGPAVEYADGSKSWLVHGKYHRLDGHAREQTYGVNEWWVDGKKYKTQEEYSLAVFLFYQKLATSEAR